LFSHQGEEVVLCGKQLNLKVFKKLKNIKMKYLFLFFCLSQSLFLYSQDNFEFPEMKREPSCGMVNEIEDLVKNKNLDVFAKLEDGWTPFSYACLCNSSFIFEEGIKQPSKLNESVNDGTTPLMLSAKNGNLNFVKKLIDNKVQINKTDKVHETALIYACRFEANSDVVKLLIGNGANLTVKSDSFGKTAIEYVICENDTVLFDILLGAHIHQKKYSTIRDKELLFASISSGNLYACEKLFDLTKFKKKDKPLIVEEVADFVAIHDLVKRDNKMLNLSAKAEKIPMDLDFRFLDFLEKKKISFEEVGDSGRTIIFRCRGIKPVVEYLIGKNIRINHLDKLRKTALQYLVEDIANPWTFKLNGFDMPIKDLNRDYSNEFSIVALFIQNNGIVNTPYKNGWTYLIIEALKVNKVTIVENLIRSNQSVFNKGQDGKSAIDIALEFGNEKVKAKLLEIISDSIGVQKQ
jgi:ankyrin repeat protein